MRIGPRTASNLFVYPESCRWFACLDSGRPPRGAAATFSTGRRFSNEPVLLRQTDTFSPDRYFFDRPVLPQQTSASSTNRQNEYLGTRMRYVSDRAVRP